MTFTYFRAALAAALLLTAAQTPEAAETKTHSQSSPLGGAWTTKVAPDTSAPSPAAPAARSDEAPLSQDQIELVERISAYFNGIEHLQGRFTQINPNNETTHGKFYVRRPGRLRFDYAGPSKLRIVADGRYLSIEDHDLHTVDQYPLEATPFGLLLGEDVDLIRDAHIVDLTHTDSVASITVEDKKDGSRGRLQLFFSLPDIELKEWVVTDPQGLDTRIQLADLVAGREVDKEFFQSSALDFESFSPVSGQ